MTQHSAKSCCNLCGGTTVTELANRSRSGKPLQTVICMGCGLAWTDPLPENVRRFYEDDYRLAYKGTVTPKAKHIWRAGKVAQHRHRLLGDLLHTPKQILDVGTGGGEFAYLLNKLGHQVQGIEPNQGYANYSRQEYGLNVRPGFIQELDLPPDSFDLITIWHVLEHTEDPSLVLTKLHSLLKMGGTLVVEVPNIEATCQAPNSTFHEAHLYHFNPATLTKMAEKVGLSLSEVRYSGDQANITLFFSKPAQSGSVKELTIPGNAERIIALRQGHTILGHYLGLNPYLRFLRKIGRIVQEQLATRDFSGGKDFLDRLYQ